MNKSVFSQTNYTLRKTFHFFETEMQVRIQKLRPLSLSFFRLKYGNGTEIKGRFLNNLDFAIQSRVCGQFTLDMTMKNEEKFKALNINHEKFTHNLLNLNVRFTRFSSFRCTLSASASLCRLKDPNETMPRGGVLPLWHWGGPIVLINCSGK